MIRYLFLLMLVSMAGPLSAACQLDRLRIALIPKTSIEAMMLEYEPLLAHLSQGLHIPAEIVPVKSYDGVIDAIVSGGVDIAWLGPASYLLAKQRDPRIEPFAMLALEGGHFTPAGRNYWSMLVVRRNGGITDIRQLKNARVALTDPSSTSGSLIPIADFPLVAGASFKQFFARQVYAGSHDRALDALLKGRVDAAFVASVSADRYVQSGKIDGDTIRVLWKSVPIHYDPYVFRGDLCPQLKSRIAQLMLEPKPALSSFLDAQQATGIVPATPDDYEGLMRYLKP